LTLFHYSALVNNAGIQDGALVDWTTASQIRNIVEVNFLGTAITTKVFSHDLFFKKKQQEKQNLFYYYIQ